MTARSLFGGADGKPRPFWRLLLFLFLSAACVIVAMIGLSPVRESLNRLVGMEAEKAVKAVEGRR